MDDRTLDSRMTAAAERLVREATGSGPEFWVVERAAWPPAATPGVELDVTTWVEFPDGCLLAVEGDELHFRVQGTAIRVGLPRLKRALGALGVEL